MRMSGFIILLGLFLLPINSVSAHLYSSIGVEAGAHVHENDEKAVSKDSKCFDDPKFGEICK